jgi:hypothetical protein
LSEQQRGEAEEAEARRKTLQTTRETTQRLQATQEALEAQFAQHRAARVRTLLAGLSGARRAEVIDAISTDIAIPSVAREWEALARDPDRLPEARKGTRKIMGDRLEDVLLARWGAAEDLVIEAFRAAGKPET